MKMLKFKVNAAIIGKLLLAKMFEERNRCAAESFHHRSY